MFQPMIPDLLTQELLMKECFHLAEQAMAHGNHPFGALLAKGGTVMLTAENTVNTDQDVTCHAELNLISQASQQFDADTLQKCWLYTSTEPCAMCSGAIHWAGIAGVVFGCPAKDLSKIVGDEIIIPACVDIFARSTKPLPIVGPILKDLAIEIHQQYW